MTDAQIREVFLAAGFQIKPGCDDLKPYVYQAARDLLTLAEKQRHAALDHPALASPPVVEATATDWQPGEWYKAETVDDMQRFYRARLPDIREAAREHGYAIGVHGSERRDFDLMAMPWRDDASDHDTLAHAIAMAACGITRSGAYQWTQKPLGRVAVSIPVCWTSRHDVISDGHIDLSVMPAAAYPLPAGDAGALAAYIREKLSNLDAYCCGYARINGGEYELASMRTVDVMKDGQLHPIFALPEHLVDALASREWQEPSQMLALRQVLSDVLALARIKFGNLDPDANRIFTQAEELLASREWQAPTGEPTALADYIREIGETSMNLAGAIAERNLRGYLTKASFAMNVDRQAALECVDVLAISRSEAMRRLRSDIYEFLKRAKRATQAPASKEPEAPTAEMPPLLEPFPRGKAWKYSDEQLRECNRRWAERLEAVEKDAARLNFLDSLMRRTEFQNQRRPQEPVHSDMHFRDTGVSLYIRNLTARAIICGNGGTTRDAIDDAVIAFQSKGE